MPKDPPGAETGSASPLFSPSLNGSTPPDLNSESIPEALQKLKAVPFNQLSFDMFQKAWGREFWEVAGFTQLWLDQLRENRNAIWAPIYQGGAEPEAVIYRPDRETALPVVNFASYDYLGFGRHPQVLKAAHEALDHYGLTAAGSPLVCGTQQVHHDLEEELRDFIQFPNSAVTLFPTGFSANTGTLSGLFHAGHLIVLDQYAHASLQEGARLSGAKVLYFKHNDPEHLEQLLKRHSAHFERVLVAVEGVYSADGDFGKLLPILEATKRHGGYLLVDEAHSMLVSGPSGRGLCAEAGILGEVDFLITTFSKGFGAVGGALIASQPTSDYLDWYAACRMFSCALEPVSAAGILEALRLGAGEAGNQARSLLHENTRIFHELLSPHFLLPEDPSWVLPILYGDDVNGLKIADHIQCRGLNGSILQFPAVNRNEGRIRLFVTSSHEKKHFETATSILVEAGRKYDFLKS